MTPFAARCYSRIVPIGRGFCCKNVRQLGLSKLIRQDEPTTTKRLIQQSAKTGPASRHQRGITLFDDTTAAAHNPESTSTAVAEAETATAKTEPVSYTHLTLPTIYSV